jgi:hypothetical protein
MRTTGHLMSCFNTSGRDCCDVVTYFSRAIEVHFSGFQLTTASGRVAALRLGFHTLYPPYPPQGKRALSLAILVLMIPPGLKSSSFMQILERFHHLSLAVLKLLL